MTELRELVRTDRDFKNVNLICLTEAWTTEDMNNINLEGYSLIRYDRDPERAEKCIGGGVCMFINTRWVTNFTVCETDCCTHYEIMTVSIRPYYLPREFGQITVILVYVPGPDFALAGERIAASYNKAQSSSVDDPFFLLGDFNKCIMSTHLPNLEQYVTCPTRMDKILDQCFGNIEGAYVSICRPPLGRSDHNVVHLLPKYHQKLKREKPVVKHIQIWT